MLTVLDCLLEPQLDTVSVLANALFKAGQVSSLLLSVWGLDQQVVKHVAPLGTVNRVVVDHLPELALHEIHH